MRPLPISGFLLAILVSAANGQAAPEDGTAVYSGICGIPGGGRLGARIFLTHAGNADQLVMERFRGAIFRRDAVTNLVIDRATGRISFSVPEKAPVAEFPARDWSGTISETAILLNPGAGVFTLTRVQTPDPPLPSCQQV